MTSTTQRNRSFTTLRRFARDRGSVERCELCSADLTADHRHLIEPASRKLLCACDACGILFSTQDGKYKRVPQRSRSLADFQMSDAQWDSLMIPITMAFFFHSTPARRIVALYPSPAGPTESLLTFESWEEIVQSNPILREMEPDVEALLVNRAQRLRKDGHEPNAEYYLAPIDECYRLTGLIRTHWRGFSGGAEVWEEIGRFFVQLNERSTVSRKASSA